MPDSRTAASARATSAAVLSGPGMAAGGPGAACTADASGAAPVVAAGGVGSGRAGVRFEVMGSDAVEVDGVGEVLEQEVMGPMGVRRAPARVVMCDAFRQR
ncbi:hypothetical protein Pth03_32640 [Planotetraspora thailandica]|uniref:Uncharacterized protein n=1 Tax=Planotetraspora thailandica TaxID=487172 RepID=A0A8J3XWE4_9ACTN|nr:hypothetical protein Pth03_32640 [Planotetraspora thailandica]